MSRSAFSSRFEPSPPHRLAVPPEKPLCVSMIALPANGGNRPFPVMNIDNGSIEPRFSALAAMANSGPTRPWRYGRTMAPTIEGSVGPSPVPSGTHPKFVRYIDKSRVFYAAHGYDKPYRWATNDDAPFTEPAAPMAQATIGIVTTSFLHQEDLPDDQAGRPKQVYAAPIEPAPNRMFTADLSWDKQATHTDDVESFLPIARLRELASAGRIGGIAPRFYGVPTEYSQRKTASDATKIEQWCREDGVDAVLLIPL